MSLRELRRHAGRLAIVGFSGHSAPAELEELIEAFDLGRRECRGEHRDAAIASAGRLQQVEEGGVIRAVAGGLHEDAARKAEDAVQGEQRFLRRVVRREPPVGGERKHCVRAEHVEMRIAGERRRRKARLPRVGIGRRTVRADGQLGHALS